jgi:hypothetical protein
MPVVDTSSASAATAAVLANQPDRGPTLKSTQSSLAQERPWGVTALTELPEPAGVPDGVTKAVSRVVVALKADAGLATATLRRLRASDEVPGAGIYAFRPADNLLCMVYWPRFGSCTTALQPNGADAVFGFSPGGPGHPGQVGDFQPAIAGVVADDVRIVSVVSNGRQLDAKISNNSFLASIKRPAPIEDWQIEVKFRYGDGTERVFNIPDPRADHSE